MIFRKFNGICFVALLSFFLGGCASTLVGSLEELHEPPVEAFFVTDRNDTGLKDPGEKYGKERASVSYGICSVSIPPGHRIGKLESPTFRKDVEEHIVLVDVSVLEKKDFFSEVSNAVNRSGEKTMLLYVHGYNVTFEKAARRMVQIVDDLDFKGIPVFYSWPSQGSVGGYPADEASVEWSEQNLGNFLAEAARISGVDTLYLLAHSMGNRALTGAFLDLVRQKPHLKSRFKALLLTAPDIDSEVFRRDIGPGLAGSGAAITLYASSRDRALRLSKRLHGYPRAGDVDGFPLIVPGIETVDATHVDTSFLGHSYYNGSRSVLSDMFYILNEELRAEQRFSLEPVDTPEGRYWRFKE